MSAARTALVIGGGIAGPVTATALRRAGIEATVYEAYPGPSEGVGGSLALAPNGVAALGLLGAADAVRAIALPITRTAMSIGGKRIDLPSLTEIEPQQIVQRGELHRALRELAEAAGVRFEHGKRLIGVEEGENHVTARFADGSTATADILVGADGVRSTVRKLIDPDAPDAEFTGMLGFQGYVEPDADLSALEPGMMTFAFGARAYYLYWKMADGRITWGANLPSKTYLSTNEAREIPAEDWLRQLRETYAGDVPGGSLAARTTAENLEVGGAIHIMPPVPHWHRARMVLVGDAVHAPSNSTGQGASLAIESAIQLARCVRDLPEPSAAFAAYEALRRDRVERITRRGARTNRAKTPGPIGRHVTRIVMPLAFKLIGGEKSLGPDLRYTIDWDAPVR